MKVLKGHRPNVSGLNVEFVSYSFEVKGEGQPEMPVRGTTPSLRIHRMYVSESEEEVVEGHVITCPTSREANGAMEWTKYVWLDGIWEVGRGPLSARVVKFIATMTANLFSISIMLSRNHSKLT